MPAGVRSIAVETTHLPGHVFVGHVWEPEVGGGPGGPVVFDQPTSREILRLWVLSGKRGFYVAKEDKFMFEGPWDPRTGRLAWRGFEATFYAGLGNIMVYLIGEGCWNWREVSPESSSGGS